MKIYRLLIVWVLFCTNVVKAQETFHNIYFFEDSIAVIHNIHATDSGYYFTAMERNKTNNRYEALFGKLSLTGEVDWYVRNEDLSSNQFSSGARTELVQNAEGYFTMGFRNNSAFRLMKYTPEGMEVMDSVYRDLNTVDSLFFFDGGRIVTVADNYYAFFTYYDELNDFDQYPGDGETGVLLIKINNQGNIVWRRRFKNALATPDKPRVSSLSCIELSDSTLLLNVREDHLYLLNEDQNWAKIHFYVIDTAGNELGHWERQDTQYNFGWPGILKTANALIYSGYHSYYTTYLGDTQPYWYYKPVITCLDENYEVVWKDSLCERFIGLGSDYVPNKYIQTSDTTFSGAYTYFYGYINPDDSNDWYTLYNIELFSKDTRTGEDLWKRNYRYFPEDSLKRYEHQIIDIERTYDDGFIMSGTVHANDSSMAGRPADYGYVIKTNCLGFLGDPQAAVTYSFPESGQVLFANQSIQAGSYLWDFGDGTQLSTGEHVDTLFHAYSDSGEYLVRLIAYGCDGRNDTLLFTINVDIEDPGYAGDGTLLTLYPNPLATGTSLGFYTGDLPEGETILLVHSSTGALVDRMIIPTSKTNYFFVCNYAAGTYFFTLENNEQRLEMEKLVVY